LTICCIGNLTNPYHIYFLYTEDAYH
jgi:hypothetical protein